MSATVETVVRFRVGSGADMVGVEENDAGMFGGPIGPAEFGDGFILFDQMNARWVFVAADGGITTAPGPRLHAGTIAVAGAEVYLTTFATNPIGVYHPTGTDPTRPVRQVPFATNAVRSNGCQIEAMTASPYDRRWEPIAATQPTCPQLTETFVDRDSLTYTLTTSQTTTTWTVTGTIFFNAIVAHIADRGVRVLTMEQAVTPHHFELFDFTDTGQITRCLLPMSPAIINDGITNGGASIDLDAHGDVLALYRATATGPVELRRYRCNQHP